MDICDCHLGKWITFWWDPLSNSGDPIDSSSFHPKSWDDEFCAFCTWYLDCPYTFAVHRSIQVRLQMLSPPSNNPHLSTPWASDVETFFRNLSFNHSMDYIYFVHSTSWNMRASKESNETRGKRDSVKQVANANKNSTQMSIRRTERLDIFRGKSEQTRGWIFVPSWSFCIIVFLHNSSSKLWAIKTFTWNSFNRMFHNESLSKAELKFDRMPNLVLCIHFESEMHIFPLKRARPSGVYTTI